jgi:hypothetical protein
MSLSIFAPVAAKRRGSNASRDLAAYVLENAAGER